MFPPKIILTNDDGIDAIGLKTLLKLITEMSEEAPIVVAPENPLSGCSHYTTVDKPIPVTQRNEQCYVVSGAPADCVRLALKELVPDAGFVISGINRGGNMGHDVYLSGTVAAAREACFHRIPAVSISQYVRPEMDLDWTITAHLALRAFNAVIKDRKILDGFWNINLPHLAPGDPEPQIAFCGCCTQPLPVSYRKKDTGYQYVRNNYHHRTNRPGTDVDVCFRGDIAISRIYL